VCTLIFDLDGTLIDSLPDVVAASNRLLAEAGRRSIDRAEGAAMVGEGAAPLIERLFEATGDPAEAAEVPALVERFVGFYRDHPADETIIYPGVIETLEALAAHHVPMGICTNKPHEMSMLVMAALGLDRFFSSVIGGGAISVKKPDPAHLLAVVEAMGADPETCVFVGDSPTDVETARRADIPVIAVSYGYSRVPPTELGADCLIDHFADLLPALDRGMGPCRAILRSPDI
jgi:phosphoglycolate phosphatase